MKRITESQLNAVVDRLNTLTGNPLKRYEKDASGKLVPQAGNYHIDCAYGGVELAQMCQHGSGTIDVFGLCHMPKRELLKKIHAYIDRVYSYE